jgi:hypothetical protein
MNEKREELKVQCGEMLRLSGVSANSKMGRAMVHAFWVGVLRTNPDAPHAYISICLMSGRYDELVT